MRGHWLHATGRTAMVCALFCAVFFGADRITGSRPHRLHLFLDCERAVPLWPPMILIYDSIYLLFLAVPFILRTREAIDGLAAAAATMIAVSGALFLLLPAELGFDPPAVTGTFRSLFVLSDRINLEYNLVPSLHVGLALLCLQAFGRGAGRAARLGLAAWGAAIAASTVLTHQHHILDAAAGAALARIVFAGIYLRKEGACSIPRESPLITNPA